MKAVVGRPLEDVTYAVFTEFLIEHKNPGDRFIIYPQLSLKWKPQDERDRRAEVPDVGVGNFTLPGTNPPFKLRFGVEAKRSLDAMKSLPPASSLSTNDDVLTAFHHLHYQAKNQAKAAIKNLFPISHGTDTVDWILLVGPYWVPVTFGAFTDAELTVRAHKTSSSADWKESAKEIKRVAGPPAALQELFLLCDDASAQRLEEIIASTDAAAKPLIDALH